MGLRTGPIQEGSQPGPRLDRKARARKDPKAQGGFTANQACTSGKNTLETSIDLCADLRLDVRHVGTGTELNKDILVLYP